MAVSFRIQIILMFASVSGMLIVLANNSNETEGFFNIARLFPKIFILCIDKRCDRHHSGYWPSDLQSRVAIYDGRKLHEHFKQLDLLRIKENGRPYHKLINTLFFSYFIVIAQKEKLSQILYLEDDLEPISKFPYETSLLENSLNNNHWELLRFGANFPIDNLHCPERCKCYEFGEMNEYLCSTTFQKIDYHKRNSLNYIIELRDDELKKKSCDLRSSIGLAIHHSAYHDIEKMYNYLLWLMNHRIHELCNDNVYKLNIHNNKENGYLKENELLLKQLKNDYSKDYYELNSGLNKDFNISKCLEFRHQGGEPDWQIIYQEVPWLDVWISSAFKNVFFTPAILTQKNMDNIGIEFSEACYQPNNHTHLSSIQHNHHHHSRHNADEEFNE